MITTQSPKYKHGYSKGKPMAIKETSRHSRLEIYLAFGSGFSLLRYLLGRLILDGLAPKPPRVVFSLLEQNVRELFG